MIKYDKKEKQKQREGGIFYLSLRQDSFIHSIKKLISFIAK